jgi:hypothetical protein
MVIRELISLHCLVLEPHKHGIFSTPLDKPFSITCTSTLEVSIIYEDKTSCISLANSQATKVCTKHISLSGIDLGITSGVVT